MRDSNPRLKKLALLGAFSDLDAKQQQNDIAQQDAMLRQAQGAQGLERDQTLLPAQLAALQAGTGLTSAQTTALPAETALRGREMSLHESAAPFTNKLAGATAAHYGAVDEQTAAMLPFMLGEAGVKLHHLPEGLDAQTGVQRAQAQSYTDEHDAGTAAAKVRGLDAQSKALLGHAAAPYLAALFGQNPTGTAGKMGGMINLLEPDLDMNTANVPEPKWLTDWKKTLPQQGQQITAGDSASSWEHLADFGMSTGNLVPGVGLATPVLEKMSGLRTTPRVRDFRHAFSTSK